VMASSGISSLRARLHRAARVIQREGLSGPPVVSAIGRWGATAAFIVLFTLLRSLNLCVVAVLALGSFLASSPIGRFLAHLANERDA
jgi:hypothetical protein